MHFIAFHLFIFFVASKHLNTSKPLYLSQEPLPDKKTLEI